MDHDWDYFLRVNRWQNLANYNGERMRGIVHTPEYDALMTEDQRAFDAETEQERDRRLDSAF